MKAKHDLKFFVTIITFIIFTTISVVLCISLINFSGNADNKNINAVRETLKKAAIHCYAIEGSYPPDIKYLSDHYGVVLNNDIYFYQYSFVGANTMPEIAVIKK